MNEQLKTYTQDFPNLVPQLSQERRECLAQIAEYVIQKGRDRHPAKLMFICTHNSRRSQMSQLWAQTFAYHFGLTFVRTYSGGIEATAFNPRAVAAMQRAGFNIEKSQGENPIYVVRYAEQATAMTAWSKMYDDSENPQSHFAAIMTCEEANEACPIVGGAEKRFTLTYVDPKVSDGSPQESQTYDQRCWQIAIEMYALMSKAADQLGRV